MRTLRELGIGVGRRLLGGGSRLAARRAAPTRRTCSGLGRRASRISAATGSSTPRGAPARRRSIPATAFSPRTRRSRARCEAAGLVWIGPPADAIEAMGSKIAARERMRAAGVPVVPGTTAPATSAADVLAAAEEVGYPIAVKASAGGGGKGLRVARTPDEVERAFETAVREGEAYFADAAVYVERYLDDPRHVEVQVLADAHGNVIHLGERDCTIQRRHQKLVEETPSPAVGPELRERIGALAVDAARAVDYRSAGTIEGLLTARRRVLLPRDEHARPGRAHGDRGGDRDRHRARADPHRRRRAALRERRRTSSIRGHAIECRINAEDVSRGFLPAPGRITAYREPAGIGVRVDSGVRAGDEISDLYDPLIAKLVVHDVDREHARRRMLRALEEFVVEGPASLLGFHRALLESPCFVAGETCHGIVESDELAQRERRSCSRLEQRARTAPAPAARRCASSASASRSTGAGTTCASTCPSRRGPSSGGATRSEARASPARRRVRSRARCRERCCPSRSGRGRPCEAGQLICVVEAMKMENELVAHRAGVVAEVHVAPGQQVALGDVVCVIGDPRDGASAARTSPRRRASRSRRPRRPRRTGCSSRFAAPGPATCPTSPALDEPGAPADHELARDARRRRGCCSSVVRARRAHGSSCSSSGRPSARRTCAGSSSTTSTSSPDVDLGDRRRRRRLAARARLRSRHARRVLCASRERRLRRSRGTRRGATISGSRPTRGATASRRTSSSSRAGSSSADWLRTNAVGVVAGRAGGRIELAHYRGRTAYTRARPGRRARRARGSELVRTGDLELVEDDGIERPLRRRRTGTSTWPSARRSQARAFRRAAAPSPSRRSTSPRALV